MIMPRVDAKFSSSDGSHGDCSMSISFPDFCPNCKASILPVYLSGWVSVSAEKLYALFECRKCYSAFMMVQNHVKKDPDGIYKTSFFPGSKLFPQIPARSNFSSRITTVSERFVLIFDQASAAETYGLFEIAGMGYRKALEFLLKDYVTCGTLETERELLLKKPLQQVIRDMPAGKK